MDHDMRDDSSTCPECGAPPVNGMTCWEQLGGILAWEAQDPELRAQHFLTVASYNLQHPAQFTKAVQDALQAAFIERLDHGLPDYEIRARMARAFGGSRRVLVKAPERQPKRRNWPMTIADVYLPDRPQGAASRVLEWAASIRRELAG